MVSDGFIALAFDCTKHLLQLQGLAKRATRIESRNRLICASLA